MVLNVKWTCKSGPEESGCLDGDDGVCRIRMGRGEGGEKEWQGKTGQDRARQGKVARRGCEV